MKNKFEKDLIENKKTKNIKRFKKYVHDNNIFLSKSGAIFLSYQNSIKDIQLILKVFKSGFKKFLI